MKKTIYNKVVGIVFLAILFSHVAYAQNERNKALIYSYLPLIPQHYYKIFFLST